MGEAKRKASTKRFVEEFPQCCLCGGVRASTTREHLPPTNLFDSFHRPESFVVPACHQCNSQSALGDLIAGIVSRLGFDQPTDEVRRDTRILMLKLKRLRPELFDRMVNFSPVARKRAFRQYRDLGLDVPVGYGAIAINGEVFQHLHLFAHKVVLAHYFSLCKRHIPASGGVLSFLRLKETVALGAIPPDLLNMLGPVAGLSQGVRRFDRDYQYRESYGAEEGVYAIACRLRVGTMIFGLAVEDLQILSESTRDGFLAPNQLELILRNERYEWYDQFAKEIDSAQVA